MFRLFFAYTGIVPKRHCRVTVTDMDEIEHTTQVSAASLYEAVALGLRAIKNRSWTGEIRRGLNTVTVHIIDDPDRIHRPDESLPELDRPRRADLPPIGPAARGRRCGKSCGRSLVNYSSMWEPGWGVGVAGVKVVGFVINQRETLAAELRWWSSPPSVVHQFCFRADIPHGGSSDPIHVMANLHDARLLCFAQDGNCRTGHDRDVPEGGRRGVAPPRTAHRQSRPCRISKILQAEWEFKEEGEAGLTTVLGAVQFCRQSGIVGVLSC